jgi:hypothetical protein
MKIIVTDDDIRARRDEYLLALKKETMASLTVRRWWWQMISMFNELLERREMNPTVKSDNPISTFKARSYEHMAEVLAESQRQAEALKKAEEIKNKEA